MHGTGLIPGPSRLLGVPQEPRKVAVSARTGAQLPVGSLGGQGTEARSAGK